MEGLIEQYRAKESSPSYRYVGTNLVLRMALEQQHIDNVQLVDVAVALELLADLGPDRRHGDVERVHRLDLRGLYFSVRSSVEHVSLLDVSPSLPSPHDPSKG